MLTTPQPKPLSYDLYEIDAAWHAGIESYRMGFRLESNPYESGLVTGHEARSRRLQAWAFSFGWRESARLEAARRTGSL